MNTFSPQLASAEAWQPLPKSEWDLPRISHLLRRAGWTALPSEIQRAKEEGLAATLERLFPAKPTAFPWPASIAHLAKNRPDYRSLWRLDSKARRAALRDYREQQREALFDLAFAWLEHAARPEFAAQEKWVIFLGDIYVVGARTVRRPLYTAWHQDILRQLGLGRAPQLTKAVTRSPAMARYLDLATNTKDAPNENFAREVFELFTLGIGNYTEQDIKEAARAFTGYRIRRDRVAFVPRLHDSRTKTVFGHTGNYDADSIVDLIYRQPAAATFVPREIFRYYLTDLSLPEAYLEPIKTWWPAHDFDLRQLALRFFGSRLFYQEAFRGNFIKSPVQFYLSLIQDFSLNVAPVPRKTLIALHRMGQELYEPPNVRGWVGGRNWINSATLAARRQLLERLFASWRKDLLNADEMRAMEAARARGANIFSVQPDHFTPLLSLSNPEIAEHLSFRYLSPRTPPSYAATLTAYLNEGSNDSRAARVHNAALNLLQSPEYQLC